MRLRYDGKLMLATGRSRMEKHWNHQELLYSELADKLAEPIRTHETEAEYAAFTKAEKDTAKDHGGYVPGYLKNGKRSASSLVNRCMVTLDADFASGDFLALLEEKLPNACVLYSTHSHTEAHPRYRLNIPLSREVTPDEYGAVSRRIAADIGMEYFDPTTFEGSRLMYWPSAPEDAEYVFKVIDKPWVDADAALATYADWHDQTLWPGSKRGEQQRQASVAKQGDPLTKPGIIGAYNRAHNMADALENVLSDVYKPTHMPDRYTFVGGTSFGGLIVYDDLFAYSHHASDPSGGKLCNAFDLVRLHKFAPGSEGVRDEEASCKAMRAYAAEDEAVKLLLAKERQASAEAFADEVAADEQATEESVNWQTKLRLNKDGSIANTLKNISLILANDPQLKHIRFNLLSDGMEKCGAVPWHSPNRFWRDADDAQLLVYLDRTYGQFTKTYCETAITKVADDRAYHPIRDYLNVLPPWDGVPRLDTLLIDYLGAVDSPYVRKVTRLTLIAAVTRVFNAGAKFDTMLVMRGPQGVGKSTLISRLGMDWYSDSLQLSDTHDKTGAEKLQGYWLLEIGELAGMRKAETEVLRSFLSRQNDIYRASFGRRATPHPRQCVFIGTTNEENGYLRDTTGNRRFWPITVAGGTKYKPWHLTPALVAQIWAEALAGYCNQEKLYLDADLSDVAEREQRAAMEQDARGSMVQEYLDRLLPDNWGKLDIQDRRNYLQGMGEHQGVQGVRRRVRVCVQEIWCECFCKDLPSMRRSDANELRTIMAALDDWRPYVGKKTNKLRFGPYGVCTGYERVPDPQGDDDLEV